MEETSVARIHVSRLFSHPNNPRKNLGDVTELANNIGQQGVLQPLTVVRLWNPDDNVPGEIYRIVLGHRRHAAAVVAGLEMVPCIARDMTEKEQLEAMLTENVQRSELTPIEEAQGFYQLRFDMGASVEEIARKTGFSESKVRQRLRIADLDATQAEAAQTRGATLQEFIAVAEVKDETERDDLLAKAGTANFQWGLDEIKKRQQAEEQKPEVRALLEKFAVEIVLADGENMYTTYQDLYSNESINLPLKKVVVNVGKYTEHYKGSVYFVERKTGFDIYKERGKFTQTPQQQKEEAERSERRERGQALDVVAQQAAEKRESFIRAYKCDKTNEREMTRLMHEAALTGEGISTTALKRLLDLPDKYAFIGMEDLSAQIKQSEKLVPTLPKFCLLFAYCILLPMKNNYHTWENKYRANEKMDALYNLMSERLGYEMSDEEAAWRDGTHELYVKTESEGA